MKKLFICSVLCVQLSGCISMKAYKGFEPVNPQTCKWGVYGILAEKNMTVVDSLTPTLTWKPTKDKESTSFDLAVWTRPGPKGSAAWKFSFDYPKYYFKENISGFSHTLEKPLEPDTFYLWSIRPRNGETYGQWSSFSGSNTTVLGSQRFSNYPFSFKTP